MGPLTGVRIVEFAGLGPGPFAGMMLADMGAEILRIERRGGGLKSADPTRDIPARGRKSITLNLKQPGATDVALRLIEQADALIEGYRPGVMERLGLGPDVCMERNPALVYGRITGWGQDGELAQAAGHDLNYIALSGALWAMGEAGRKPMPPLNLVGDFGGGGMFLAFGIVCGLMRAKTTGQGDIVDAAISDGTAALMAPVYGYQAMGGWKNERQSNRLDGGAPYYGTYDCKCGGWITLGAIEPQFYSLFMETLGLSEDHFGDRHDQSKWPDMRDQVADVFRQKTRDEWCTLMEGTDICFAPVLSMAEAPDHPHNRSRETFVAANGVVQPAPAPRFTNAPAELPSPPPAKGQHNDTALLDWGFSKSEISQMLTSGML
jgi:alpha-methylacyl-CoA racemase